MLAYLDKRGGSFAPVGSKHLELGRYNLTPPMKIAITGGSGFIGSRLSKIFSEDNHEVVVFGRHIPKEKIPNVLFLQTDLIHDLPLDDYLACDVVIHLAGANIFGRWTKKYKQLILDSRVKTALSLINSVKKAGRGPKVFVTASAVGYYGDGGEIELTEASLSGNDFLARVCKEWEAVGKMAEEVGMRSVWVRMGLVLGSSGGILKKIIPIFRCGLGGPIGSGKQWISWIHIEDLLNVYKAVVFDGSFVGPVNATSPYPIKNKEFAKVLGDLLHVPSFFPVPGFLIKMVLGERAEIVLISQKVIPQKLINKSFNFMFPKIDQALDLLHN